MKSPLTKIHPSEIATQTGHWFNSFGRSEIEISAKLFVRACQRAGKWEVSKVQLDRECSSGDYRFNGLIEDGYILKDGEIYKPSGPFVCIAYGKFPAKSENDVVKEGS